jgi:DNA-binding CsgD family transcriptional regulator/tetratricopeptide (TPR) repeat protein
VQATTVDRDAPPEKRVCCLPRVRASPRHNPRMTGSFHAACDLLERGQALDALVDCWASASAGNGRVALVAGEAGIGKSALVDRLARHAAADGDVYAGACDALFTPRPLGPLHDILYRMHDDALSAAAAHPERHRLFVALLEALRRRTRPTLLVFEDLHWADEATLDLLTFVGRRIAGVPALVVLTYRDDEVGPRHALRAVLGELPRATTLRIVLERLSEHAVRALADAAGRTHTDLFTVTGGNPFFVTEVLASEADGVPATVRDAVLARAARLAQSAREALDLVSLSPVPIEPDVVAACLDDACAALDACVTHGMLRIVGDRYAFGHELARLAIRDTVSPTRRIAISRRLLGALEARDDRTALLPRLAHHAEDAGDRDALLAYAPAAGHRAAGLGAHREARAHFERALKAADGLPAAELASLCAALGQECQLVGDIERAIEVRTRAVALARSLGDRRLEGDTLCRLMVSYIAVGRNADAEAVTRAALELLEPLPPSATLALAYRTQAALRMFDRDNREAVQWAEKAIALARRFDDVETVISATNALGSALVLLGEESRGRALLEESGRMAEVAALDGHVSNAYSNLGSAFGEMYRFEIAEANLDAGMRYAEARDQTYGLVYALAWQAVCHLHRGRWDETARVAERVLARPGVAAISRIMALLALGRLRSRRGDPGADDVLDEALALATRTGTLQRIGPVRAARAEAAWLAGDRDRAATEASVAYPLAVAKAHPWIAGELAYWQWRAGALASVPDFIAEPFRLEIEGAPAGRTAAAWSERLCPYEAARALGEGPDEASMKRALRALETLGARPASEAVRERLRALGARGIPRGPRPATRANRFGLTQRELEVVALLAQGLSNAAIAARLHRAEKTVDHHVSAVLAKLDVRTRDAAARAAAAHGLLPD